MNISTQAHKLTSSQAHKLTSSQAHKLTNSQAHKPEPYAGISGKKKVPILKKGLFFARKNS
jgi:hypothetical protein